jgi:trigger factor
MQVKKIDSANSTISVSLQKDVIDAQKKKVAKQMSKTIKVDGFRKGKVPVAVIESRFAQNIEEDAINELVRDTYESGLTELNINKDAIIGEPKFSKFDKKENEVEIEIAVATKPEINIEGYEEVIPETKLPEVLEEEVQTKIEEYAKNSAEPTKVEKEVVESGDFAVINFKGFIDGEEMENGTAENYPLELGSNSFIPGFEDQIVGMKVGESKDVVVTFPEEYQSKEIAGKEAKFEVTLNEIRQKTVPEINDELANKLLQKEDSNVEELKAMIKDEVLATKKAQLFAPKKSELTDALLEKFSVDLPEPIVENEANIQLNQKASTMKPEEVKAISEDEEKLNVLREEAMTEAKKRVKLTFLIDEIAKAENIEVSDDEVMQAIYYEAIRNGEQDIMKVVDYYKENNLLPAVKMSMVEDKLLNQLLEKKAN